MSLLGRNCTYQSINKNCLLKFDSKHIFVAITKLNVNMLKIWEDWKEIQSFSISSFLSPPIAVKLKKDSTYGDKELIRRRLKLIFHFSQSFTLVQSHFAQIVNYLPCEDFISNIWRESVHNSVRCSCALQPHEYYSMNANSSEHLQIFTHMTMSKPNCTQVFGASMRIWW